MILGQYSFRFFTINFIWLCQPFIFILGKSPLLYAAEHSYRPEDSGVSFEQIIELPSSPSDYEIYYGLELLQFGQLWLPKRGSYGTVIFVHGGCWMNEYDIDHTKAFASALASSGYAVWSLEYRRTGDPGGAWPGTFEDVILGINKLADLEGYDINMDKVALMGHSAGGHLAVLAGVRPELLKVKPTVVIGLAAITDLKAYAKGENSCQKATIEFMNGSPDERPSAFENAQPGNFEVVYNTILFYGGADQIVPSSQASLSGATGLRHESAGHFDWIHPGTSAFQEILSVLSKEL
tara:strand:- start:77 stop:958 length:882 start_codon:yes stop_codon:yes gene_type:complete